MTVPDHDTSPQGHSIFAAQISVRQSCNYRNLDAELIDLIKRSEKLRHLI